MSDENTESFLVASHGRPTTLAGGRPAEPGTVVHVDPAKHQRQINAGDLKPYVEPDPVADDLEPLTRAELDAIAADLGVDPKSYPNKTAIAAAIREARQEG